MTSSSVGLHASRAVPPVARPASGEEERADQARTLRAQGTYDAESWRVIDSRKGCDALRSVWQNIQRALREVSSKLRECAVRGEALSVPETAIVENGRLLHTLASNMPDFVKYYRGPALRRESRVFVPRIYALAVGYLRSAGWTADERSLALYLEGVQHVDSLWMGEIWALKPALEFALLEQISAHAIALPHARKKARGPETADIEQPGDGSVQKAIDALRTIQEIDWEKLFEQNSATEQILRRDPAGAYSHMDAASRRVYLSVVEDLARRSTFGEDEVARQAVFLAIRAKDCGTATDPSRPSRRAHVGYYLIDSGSKTLKRRLGYRPTLRRRLLNAILEWPEVYYIVGVELSTLLLAFLVLGSFGVVIPLLAGLLLLIPASQAAIGIVNNLTGILVPPRRIPKLDFSDGIPSECTALVAVPCMLLSEAEVRRNVESLEIRYLGNRDPHLHFALLTDSPDASQPFDEHDELVGLCSDLIKDLQQRYAPDRQASFLHLHRHRIYNPSEGAWMGWERKRGKLMDLNDLLLNTGDSFPVKAGDVAVLSDVRYVITLDSDTKLPPGSAHRLVGALAHPLNRAVIDPETNTVVEGYGILQPRVSVSIESAQHSRLASIYSGQTAFDIYSLAASDVYQDLFGEGSFTGKGIYDVEAVHRVLRRRFPTNALLSHDLIEGTYTRAGLVSDIVVIDDYPSHFSAYCRRLHRWVRGDWQIMRWLFPRVPDFYRRQTPNPLTFISRWKILDNLRRSVNDIGLFLLLILGWTILPGGPVYWTLVTLALLLLPTYCQLLFSLVRVQRKVNWRGFVRERINDLITGHLQVFVMIVFLPHQALIMVDAIVRTIARLTITHSNLLEWETAAEAEIGKKKTPVEIYLTLAPWLVLAIGLILAAVRPAALVVAGPILALWLLEDFFTKWVNRRPVDRQRPLSPERESLLRLVALRTWRYFRELSTAENHWLIPDNIQEDPPLVALRLSPTNLGLLLNGQLAALGLGYLTLAEYAFGVERTLNTVKLLPRHRGHFYNWYDIKTCQPLEPLFVSTVDSGNLAACLWTLKQSYLGLAHEPVLPANLWRGLRDHFELLAHISREGSVPEQILSTLDELGACAKRLGADASLWMGTFPWLEQQIRIIESVRRGASWKGQPTAHPLVPDLEWWLEQTAVRLQQVREHVETFVPWALPEYLSLSRLLDPMAELNLISLPRAIAEMEKRLAEFTASRSASDAEMSTVASLQRRLPASLAHATRLLRTLRRVAETADRLVREMDFRFLYNPKRKLLSIGYNVGRGELAPSCYDLLASEARTAVFIAAAKGDVHQEAWFRLGRAHTLAGGKRALLSWSGTLFEYLMPGLWMRSLPETIMDEAIRAAIHCQQRYARANKIPWGISEAAFSARDTQGTYQYQAFGLPELAVDGRASESLVVSPYSSFLALPIEAEAAVRNLESLREMGCLGSLGFYESCDFTSVEGADGKDFEIVRCWMAHHQGMSLLAISNFLNHSSNQEWFHREPRVKAVQVFLHEKVSLSLAIDAEPATLYQPREADVMRAANSFRFVGVRRWPARLRNSRLR